MSTREPLVKARLGMRVMADELKNLAKACKLAGGCRSRVYEIKKAYATFGKEGLAPQHRRRPRLPNPTPPELERRILAMTEQYPTARSASSMPSARTPAASSTCRSCPSRPSMYCTTGCCCATNSTALPSSTS